MYIWSPFYICVKMEYQVSIVNWRDKGETGEVKESWISQHKYKVFVLGK